MKLLKLLLYYPLNNAQFKENFMLKSNKPMMI